MNDGHLTAIFGTPLREPRGGFLPPRFRTEVLRASPRNAYEVKIHHPKSDAEGFSADEDHIGSFFLGL